MQLQASSTFVCNRHHRIQMTRHAEKRAQQRGFRCDAVQLIRAFGDRAHDGHGAVRYSMTDRAMKRVVRSIGQTQQIDALAGAYGVVAAEDESTAITVSHRWS